MVKVLQQAPCHFLNLVAGINHVDSFVNTVLYLNREDTGMPVQVLCFPLKTVETVGILQIKCCDTTHS